MHDCTQNKDEYKYSVLGFRMLR